MTSATTTTVNFKYLNNNKSSNNNNITFRSMEKKFMSRKRGKEVKEKFCLSFEFLSSSTLQVFTSFSCFVRVEEEKMEFQTLFVKEMVYSELIYRRNYIFNFSGQEEEIMLLSLMEDGASRIMMKFNSFNELFVNAKVKKTSILF